MDTVTLVENQIDDGQRLLDKLDEQGFVVRAACWVKPAEEDRWSLYLATPVVDKKGGAAAYRQVYNVLRSLGGVSITDSDIKLVGEKHPLAQDLLNLQRQFPGRTPTRSRRSLVGDIPAEEVYVYAPGNSTPVKVTIYGLVFRGEPGGTLHLSLEPHNPHSKMMVEKMGQRIEYTAETGTDWIVAAPEGATLERDKFGRMVLAWNFRGNRSSGANEVWSFAKLGLHGFRFLHEPP
jgi:hypothetical protein